MRSGRPEARRHYRRLGRVSQFDHSRFNVDFVSTADDMSGRTEHAVIAPCERPLVHADGADWHQGPGHLHASNGAHQRGMSGGRNGCWDIVLGAPARCFLVRRKPFAGGVRCSGSNGDTWHAA